MPLLVLLYDGLVYAYAGHVARFPGDRTFLMSIGSAKIDYLVSQGEVWRLLSAVFLHIAAWHLILNIIGLAYLSRFVQSYISGTAVVAIFLCAGILGTFASYLVNVHPSMGASGAVYGLAGAVVWVMLRDKQRGHVLWALGMVVILGVALLYDSQHKWIDLAAHTAGLATGLVLAPLMPTTRKQEAGIGMLIVTGTLALFCLLQAFRYESLAFDVPSGPVSTANIDDTIVAWPTWWEPGHLKHGKCVAEARLDLAERPFTACLRGPLNGVLVIGPTRMLAHDFAMPPPPNGVSVSRLTRTGLKILMLSIGPYSYVLITRVLVIRKYFPLLYRIMLFSGSSRFTLPLR